MWLLVAACGAPPPSRPSATDSGAPESEATGDTGGTEPTCTPMRYWTDGDTDGFGDDAYPVDACERPPGTAPTGGDCDDADPTVHPGAPDDTCDHDDDDCDGVPDEEQAFTPWYADVDGDGAGVEPGALDCAPMGRAPAAGDCDDGNPAVAPGLPEGCDGIDTDCDGAPAAEELDADLDGVTSCAGDCDDADGARSPLATERCGNGVDEDCSGSADLAPDCEYAPGYGDVVVTEVMGHQVASGAPDGEWFEVQNRVSFTVELTGVRVTDAAGGSFLVAERLTIAPGAIVVLAASADPLANGGLTPDAVFAGPIELGDAGALTLTTWDGGTVDAVAWDPATGFPVLAGASLTARASADADGNDDPALWCPGTVAFGAGDLGTPGGPDPACP